MYHAFDVNSNGFSGTASGSCIPGIFLASYVFETMNAFPVAIVPSIKSWANAALAFIYPECCQLCGQERATPAEG